jgi:arylsulfatase A-like enzyme
LNRSGEPEVAIAEVVRYRTHRRLASAPREWGFVAALLTIAIAGCGQPRLLPNVVVISLDTVRADHLPFYGYERKTAPALTALAARGAVFENSYSQAPSTLATHGSLFTGRYPFQHGMYTVRQHLKEQEHTLAEHLRDHGYRTFAITSSIRFEPRSGYPQGFDTYETLHHLEKNERSARVTNLALETAEMLGSGPFFAFLHYFDAHAPYAVPEPYRTLWHPGLSAPRPEDTIEFLRRHRWPGVVVAPEVIDYLRSLYDGALRYQDESLRPLFEGLEAIAGSRPTLWIVTADHGEEFKEHGFLSHSFFLHEELVRVPLVMVFPGVIAAGLRIGTPFQTVDLFPTIVELLGLPTSEALSGRSFAARLQGRDALVQPDTTEARDVAILESALSWSVIATLGTGRFKLVAGRENGLYRLDVDPSADEDVASKYPAEMQRLFDISEEVGMPQARSQLTPPPPRREAPNEAEVLERLRAIGYAEEAEAAR